MFSGIIETTAEILEAIPSAECVKIKVTRPADFIDVRIGDSIATNGVCLTVEELAPSHLLFSLAPETLKVTGWTPKDLLKRAVNLERSLKLGDRIHGHLVSGHVDDTGVVQKTEAGILWIAFGPQMRPFIWRKGSVAIQGVSLTINEVSQNAFSVCLIPETLKRTNLGILQEGDRVNLEADSMARAWFHWRKIEEDNHDI